LQLEVEDVSKCIPAIKPYRTRPQPGSIAMRFLQRLNEYDGEWVPTRKLYDIYRSTWGTHVNLLIKLAKSGYIESAKSRDVAIRSDGQPVEVTTRFWRITEKGKKLAKRWSLTDEQLYEYNKRRLTNYLAKRRISYVVNDDVCIIEGVHQPLTVVLTHWINWRHLYWQIKWANRHRLRTERDVKVLREAEQWLSEHPGLKTSVETPIGRIEVKGDVTDSWFTVNGDYVCIVPNKALHRYDEYIWRLQMLNWYTDNLVRTIYRYHLLTHCPNCKEELGFRRERMHYCPYCAYDLEAHTDRVLKSLPVM